MSVLRNAKHEAVLQAFLADRKRVGWRAYKKVYRNSSKHAAETAWSRLLKVAEFAARASELTEKVTEAVVNSAIMSAQEVLEGLTAIARGNLQDAAHLTICDDIVGELRALPRAHAAAIAELTVESYADGSIESQEKQAHGGSLKRAQGREVKRVKLKLHDKRGALQDLGRHYKLFGTDLDLGGDVIVEIRKFSDGRAGAKTKRAA